MQDFDGVVQCAEASVKALGLAYVDLYLIHAPFAFAQSTDAGLAQWKACLALKERGLCRAVGVSNFSVKHLQAIADAGLALPDANQLELHPMCQQTEILAWMKERGVLPIAYSSLAPLGTWRVKGDGSKQDSGKHRGADKADAADKAVSAIAAAHAGLSSAQVLLRWALQKGYAILPKSSKVERIKANADLFGYARMLSAPEMATLDALNAGGDVCLAWKGVEAW